MQENKNHVKFPENRILKEYLEHGDIKKISRKVDKSYNTVKAMLLGNRKITPEVLEAVNNQIAFNQTQDQN